MIRHKGAELSQKNLSVSVTQWQLLDFIGNKEKRPEGWCSTSFTLEKNLRDGVHMLFPIKSHKHLQCLETIAEYQLIFHTIKM
jgi:hypothetical protein